MFQAEIEHFELEALAARQRTALGAAGLPQPE
jgi:hypothetical protein